MRRGPGIAGLKKSVETNARFKEKGEHVAEVQLSQLQQQLQTFQSHLETFAAAHRDQINKDPQLRYHVQKMCAKIGVDPLASKKGFWADTLGLGSFYYELGVQIVGVCMDTRPQNGGLLEVCDLLELLRAKRGRSASPITAEDVHRAIKKLRVLGDGYDIVVLQGRSYVQSVPVVLNRDHLAVLAVAQDNSGMVTIPQLVSSLGWEPVRGETVVERMLSEGLCWLDAQNTSPNACTEAYWFPCMCLTS
jgi:ESCRT-II complex subunit VPS22